MGTPGLPALHDDVPAGGGDLGQRYASKGHLLIPTSGRAGRGSRWPARGLPLLSPIVRRSRTAKPPAGIASLLRQLGLLADVLAEVVEEERQRTWRYYRRSSRHPNAAAGEAGQMHPTM